MCPRGKESHRLWINHLVEHQRKQEMGLDSQVMTSIHLHNNLHRNFLFVDPLDTQNGKRVMILQFSSLTELIPPAMRS